MTKELHCEVTPQTGTSQLQGFYRITYERVIELPVGRGGNAKIESSFVLYEGRIQP
jgi:hypothetical protein